MPRYGWKGQASCLWKTVRVHVKNTQNCNFSMIQNLPISTIYTYQTGKYVYIKEEHSLVYLLYEEYQLKTGSQLALRTTPKGCKDESCFTRDLPELPLEISSGIDITRFFATDIFP
jgi:hypothetical protein